MDKRQITLHEAHNSALGKTIERLSREKAALESQLAEAKARVDELEAALKRIRDERGVRPYDVAREALRHTAAQPDCDHPFRVKGDVCLNCGAADAGAEREGEEQYGLG